MDEFAEIRGSKLLLSMWKVCKSELSVPNQLKRVSFIVLLCLSTSRVHTDFRFGKYGSNYSKNRLDFRKGDDAFESLALFPQIFRERPRIVRSPIFVVQKTIHREHFEGWNALRMNSWRRRCPWRRAKRKPDTRILCLQTRCPNFSS